MRLAPRYKQLDDLGFDVDSGRCLDQQISEAPVVGGEDPSTVMTVAVEQPSGQKQSGSLVALSEGLGARYSMGEHGRRHDGIFDSVDSA